jgi:CRISPR-associated protein Cmr2
MADTMLILAIGPVQDFIARARRTRDLWFGSHILSELSRAAAKSLASTGWTLVFPALRRGDRELEPCDGPMRRRGEPALAIVNKIVAIGGTDPEHAAGEARQAAIARWAGFARDAFDQGGRLLRPDRSLSHLQSAIEDLLEFYSGWATGPYAETRRSIEAELTARKNLRDFPAWDGLGLPKSSLDGFRETVLADALDAGARRIGRLGANEQLDGIGFVKRLGGDPEQFPSVARVAVQPWIEVVAKTGALEGLDHSCRECGIGTIDSRATMWAKEFPFDGEVLFRDRWKALEEESGHPVNREIFGNLLKGRDPSPYAACLVADGDGMGEALNALTSPDEHQTFSHRLGEWASGASGIVECHGGALVYSGGDDVLALVPVHTALEAARDLARTFQEQMGNPTLSVGVAIAHFLTPLGELLDLGRRAEKLAKGNGLADTRNALGVILSKRGGAEVEWRARWTTWPVERLRDLADAFSGGRMPDGFAYELRGLLLRMPRTMDDDWTRLLRDELWRTWRRKTAPGKPDRPPELDPGSATRNSVQAWIELAAISRHLSEHDQLLRKAGAR